MKLTIANPMRTTMALALALLPAAVLAQKYTPEPPPLTTAPCKPTKKSPCSPPAQPAPAANAFPFPGESQQDPPAEIKPATATPGAFPFPGEPPAPATPGALPFPGETPAESSSSSSSASPDANPDPAQPALKDEGTTGSTRFSRKKLPKVTVIDPDEREAKDIEVSHYYFSTGNFDAAYLRAKDAVTIVPEDPAAHLALADSALRLNKFDEAASEYNQCLKLDASDDQKKEARKGLTQLASSKPVRPPAK